METCDKRYSKLPDAHKLKVDGKILGTFNEVVKYYQYVCDIGDKAFYGCKSLKTITIPKSVNYIELGAFYDCNNLSIVKFPYHLQYDDHEVFGENSDPLVQRYIL